MEKMIYPLSRKSIHLSPRAKISKEKSKHPRIFHFTNRTRSRKREREQKFSRNERKRRVRRIESALPLSLYEIRISFWLRESPIEDLTGRMSRFAFPKAFNSSKAGHSGPDWIISANAAWKRDSKRSRQYDKRQPPHFDPPGFNSTLSTVRQFLLATEDRGRRRCILAR